MVEQKQTWCRVTLRLMGDALPVDEVAKVLSLTPYRLGRKGEPMGGKVGRTNYETNIWRWTFPAESHVRVEEQIGEVLEAVESKEAEWERLVSRPGVRAELFVGYGSENGQGGFELSPTMLHRLAGCGLWLNLDLYPPTLDEVEF
jgi:hypothetical protein